MSIIQNEEIKTIKARSLILNLSNADVERLFEKAGSVGLTPSDLLENFICDLVCGTYTNGSDERMYANDWFDRCSFGMGKTSFLQWLIACTDVDLVIDDWFLLKSFKEDEEMGVKLDEDDIVCMAEYKDELNEIFNEYKESNSAAEDSTLESEMQEVLRWYEQKRSMSASIQRHEQAYQNEDGHEEEW